MSTTINTPEFQNYIGKNAEIIILIDNTTESDNQFMFKAENSKKVLQLKKLYNSLQINKNPLFQNNLKKLVHYILNILN
jgi:hypothetical protein